MTTKLNSLYKAISFLLLLSLIASCKFPSEFLVNVPNDLIMQYRKFIPSDEEIIKKSYTHVTTKLPNGNTRLRRFYPEKYQCTHEMTFSSNGKLIGQYKEWWDDGLKKDEGQYEDGKKTGLWKSYALGDGTLRSELNYKDDEKHGIEKIYNKTNSTYTYNMGIKEGAFVIHDSTGLVINEGIYRADTIFQQTLIQEEKEEVFKVVETMPKFPGCDENTLDEEEKRRCATKKMLTYIYTNIKYPVDARENGIQGSAIIRFVVDKTGEITKVQTVRGICESIEAECLRLVKSMPTWNPGTQRGKAVKVQFNLPIKFKLQ